MCYVWQNPTNVEDEITLDTLKKIPEGICYLNLTGGEPTLRKDLSEIVDLLYPKAKKLEISTNGLNWKRLEPIVKRYPDIKIRFSLEGRGEINDRIRGERNGYQRKIEGLLHLKGMGAKDIGIATVIQDDNAEEIIELFKFAKRNGLEFATSTLHNGFQFHKSDNFPYDRERVARYIGRLVVEMLKGYDIKNWFRAYLNLGLMAKVLGRKRLLPCGAGEDFVFIDPWSDVYACNVRPDLRVGNLMKEEWDAIIKGPLMIETREKVKNCVQNCWMVGSAKTAMRNKRYPQLPALRPLSWVIYNKIKTIFCSNIDLEVHPDLKNYGDGRRPSYRRSFLDEDVKKRIRRRDDEHYKGFGEFINV